MSSSKQKQHGRTAKQKSGGPDKEEEIKIMKKSIRNLIIGAAMTAGIFAASSAALAATQFVQTDMNFRSGASATATLIGSVPAGAQVEVLDMQNGWNRKELFRQQRRLQSYENAPPYLKFHRVPDVRIFRDRRKSR